MPSLRCWVGKSVAVRAINCRLTRGRMVIARSTSGTTVCTEENDAEQLELWIFSFHRNTLAGPHYDNRICSPGTDHLCSRLLRDHKGVTVFGAQREQIRLS